MVVPGRSRGLDAMAPPSRKAASLQHLRRGSHNGYDKNVVRHDCWLSWWFILLQIRANHSIKTQIFQTVFNIGPKVSWMQTQFLSATSFHNLLHLSQLQVASPLWGDWPLLEKSWHHSSWSMWVAKPLKPFLSSFCIISSPMTEYHQSILYSEISP